MLDVWLRKAGGKARKRSAVRSSCHGQHELFGRESLMGHLEIKNPSTSARLLARSLFSFGALVDQFWRACKL